MTASLIFCSFLIFHVRSINSFRCDRSKKDYTQPCFPMPYENGIDGCSTFVRSAAVCQTNEVQIEKRQQMNTITGFIDASMVYGSSQGEAEKLRVLDSKNLFHFFYCWSQMFSHSPPSPKNFSFQLNVTA